MRRIRQTQEQRRERSAERAKVGDSDLAGSDLGPEQPGQVIAHYGSSLVIEDAEGSLHRCVQRQNMDALACGDHIVWRSQSGGNDGVIVALGERGNLLSKPDYSGNVKPVAANIDQVGIVAAPIPVLNEFLIDRYLVEINRMGAEAIIVINKTDLLNSEERMALELRLSDYQRIGYPVLFSSTVAEVGLRALRDRLKSKTSILVGQSGVGKSSLINALLPDLDIRTQAVSAATGHGTHTTTTSTLYHLPEGGDLVDSPGIRSFELYALSEHELADGFVEFAPFIGQCKFSDCSHREEPGCKILQAVEDGAISQRRFESYHQLRLASEETGKR